MYNSTEYSNKSDTYYQHNRDEMLKYIPVKSQKILEVGCGNGAFGKLVKEKIKCEYWGIEPDSRFTEVAKQNLDFFLNLTFDNEIDLPTNAFDLIVFNDVLEHVLYPEEIIQTCKKFLKNEGCILSSIPNIRHIPYLYRLFYLGEFEYELSGIMDRTHFRFFTFKSVKRMYERCGFKIILNEGINKFIPIKFKILVFLANLFTNGKFKDVKYQQIATLAQYS